MRYGHKSEKNNGSQRNLHGEKGNERIGVKLFNCDEIIMSMSAFFFSSYSFRRSGSLEKKLTAGVTSRISFYEVEVPNLI
jgi:hypothetical protein